MFNVNFNYEGQNLVIQCQKKEKMKEIINKFIEKRRIDINFIYFIYSGNKIENNEIILEQVINEVDKKRNEINIIVTKKEVDIPKSSLEKSKEIICPECKEDANISFRNYKISFKCENGHDLKNFYFEEFDKTQMIDISKIICEKCQKKKSETFNKLFYRCNSCKMNLCPLCQKKHDQTHNIINYKNKKFICEIHNQNYSLYCNSCNKNICFFCENEHNIHNITSFGKMATNKEDLNTKKSQLKEKIDGLKKNIEEMINILNKTANNFEKYYKIIDEILNSYINQKINFHILYNVREVFNNNIIENLDNILNENNIINKFTYIHNIYMNMTNKNINSNDESMTTNLYNKENNMESHMNTQKLNLLGNPNYNLITKANNNISNFNIRNNNNMQYNNFSLNNNNNNMQYNNFSLNNNNNMQIEERDQLVILSQPKEPLETEYIDEIFIQGNVKPENEIEIIGQMEILRIEKPDNQNKFSLNNNNNMQYNNFSLNNNNMQYNKFSLNNNNNNMQYNKFSLNNNNMQYNNYSLYNNMQFNNSLLNNIMNNNIQSNNYSLYNNNKLAGENKSESTKTNESNKNKDKITIKFKKKNKLKNIKIGINDAIFELIYEYCEKTNIATGKFKYKNEELNPMDDRSLLEAGMKDGDEIIVI